IRSGVPEKFTKKLTFDKASYTPGSKVIATAELKLGDKPVAGAKGTVVVASDEIEPGSLFLTVKPQATKDDGTSKIPLVGLTNDKGQFELSFALPSPEKLTRGDVKVMVVFNHDG